MLALILEIFLQLILEIFAESILGLVWWLVLFPIVWMVSAPFILLFAFFCSRPYWMAVFDLFVAVHHFWHEHGANL